MHLFHQDGGIVLRKRRYQVFERQKQSLQIEGYIMLHLRLEDLCARLWFGISPHLTVSMLLGTAFVVCFSYGICPSKRKLVLLHSHPVALLTNPKPAYSVNSTQSSHEKPEQMENEVERTSIIRMARKIFYKPRTEHHVMVTTNAQELEMIEPQTLSTRRQCSLSEQGIMDISPNWPYYTLFSNFLLCVVRLS